MAHLIHFPVGFAVLLHVFFWGLGPAILAMPSAWRRFWPVLIMPAGFVLQSAVVWLGAYLGLHGTNSYAWMSEAVPVALIVCGLWRRGVRAVVVDLNRFGLVWLLMGGCLALLITPLAIASKSLTTTSLGSCDAADYAAGGRVFMEFARGDRAGFLGQAEVVGIGSTDNFFDFWLRLNHFSPSALIALNGTILGCAPHEITGLLTMVFLVGTLPMVFWIARAVVGYSGGASLGVALIFGLSPITWYAVAHVAMSQILGAQAIAVITWPAIALWRGRLTSSRALQFSAVLALGYGLLLGSYNFMLIICLVPAVAFAGGSTLWHGTWRRLAQWAIAVLAPLALAAACFWDRVAVLPERFLWFRTYDFGWRIPAFSPEGWLGMISGPALEAWTWLGLRWGLSLLVGVAFGWALVRSTRRRHPGAWLVIALTAPVLLGYAFLEMRGARLGTNASYDAYKIFMVFYPLLLPAFCWWLTLRRSRRLTEWFGVVALACVILAFNLVATAMFMWRMAQPPLIVDGELRQLRKIEAMADVKSVNLLIPDMWARLWANAFLLRKLQYFPTHTYEGRRNTPLRGEWDLEGGLIRIELPEGARRPVTTRFALVDTRHPWFVRADIDEQRDQYWNAEERARTGESWRWTSGDATIQLENPHDYPLALDATIDGWSPAPREVALVRRNDEAPPSVRVTEQRAPVKFRVLSVPPGRSTLVLETKPPAAPVFGDPRPLGVCVFHLTIAPRK